MTDVNLDYLLPESHPTDAGVVSWSPPMPNWNPWTGCNIDEGIINLDYAPNYLVECIIQKIFL